MAAVTAVMAARKSSRQPVKTASGALLKIEPSSASSPGSRFSRARYCTA